MKVLRCFGLVFLTLVGCAPPDEAFDPFPGAKHNLIVLSPSALDISQPAIGFAQLVGAEVVGRDAAVCVVLASGVPRGGQGEVLKRLGGAKLSATVITSDGAHHDFDYQGSSWVLRGKISHASEL